MTNTELDLTNPDLTEVIVDLDNPAHKGTVIARVGGFVVFVRGGLPGEKQVTVELDELTPAETKRAAKGKLKFRTGAAVKIGTPSSHRVEPECEATTLGAGCCDLDFVDSQGSMDFKRQVVIDQMQRIGGLEIPAEGGSLGEGSGSCDSTSLWPFAHYRTRVRLGVDAEGRAGIRKPKSHDILPIAEAECVQWVTGLTDGIAQMDFTPGAEVIIAVGRDGQRAAIETKKVGKRRINTVVEGAGLNPEGIIVQSHLGVTWELPVQAFWQAHMSASAFYARWVADRIPDIDGVVWDLYGGAGALSAGIATKVAAIDIVDVASAATDAGVAAFQGFAERRQADTSETVADIRFVDGAVEKTLEQLRHEPKLHAVILDPPRTGAGKDVIASVAGYEPEHVIHVGCDPATAARDLAAWRNAGYQLAEMNIVDAFGMTHHVETLMHFTRDGVSATD